MAPKVNVKIRLKASRNCRNFFTGAIELARVEKIQQHSGLRERMSGFA
jgi:hypothetical protein